MYFKIKTAMSKKPPESSQVYRLFEYVPGPGGRYTGGTWTMEHAVPRKPGCRYAVYGVTSRREGGRVAKRYLYLFSFGFYEAAVLLCNVEPDRYAEALLSMPRLLAVSAKVPESAMPGLHDKLNAVLGEIMFEYAVTEEFRIGRDNNAKRAEVMSRIEAERRDDDMRRERRRSIAEVEEARLAPLKEAARALLRKTFRYLLKESHSDRSRKDDANERFIFYKEAETELDRIFRSKDMIEFLPYEDEDGEIPF